MHSNLRSRRFTRQSSRRRSNSLRLDNTWKISRHILQYSSDMADVCNWVKRKLLELDGRTSTLHPTCKPEIAFDVGCNRAVEWIFPNKNLWLVIQKQNQCNFQDMRRQHSSGGVIYQRSCRSRYRVDSRAYFQPWHQNINVQLNAPRRSGASHALYEEIYV